MRADAGHLRVRPLHLHEPLLPRPGGAAAGAVPRPRRSARRSGCRTKSAASVPRVQDGLQAGLHHGAGAGLPEGCQTEMRTCTRTSAAWCRSSTSATRRGRAATRCPRRRSARSRTRPAAWCREQHVRSETRTRCYTVPEHHVRHQCYTTCRMVPETHVQHGDAARAATTCRK